MNEEIMKNLESLGVAKETTEKLRFLKTYFYHGMRGGAFDMNWTHSVIAVRDFGDFVVALVGEHQWSDRGGGIEMSVKIFVEDEFHLSQSESMVYRHCSNPKLDRWDLNFTKIKDACYDSGKYSVCVSTPNGSARTIITI